MKCILIKDGKGPAENLYLGEEPTPEPKDGQIRVKVKAFGLNRMDITQREGRYPLPPQASKTILGVEFSGVVDKVGPGATKFKVGDAVFGLTYGGAYAEYVVNPEVMCLPKPDNLDWVQAAAAPENWMTAYQALFTEGGMKPGDNVLVHAGASGVGNAAIQLALWVGKANKVYTTAGTDDKVRWIKEKVGKGDERVTAINYKTQDFEEEIKKVDTEGKGINLIIDFVGKDYFARNINVMARDATLIYLSFLSGANVTGSLAPLLFKRLTIKGSTLRSRTVEYQQKLLESFDKQALPLIRDGQMSLEVHEVIPWTDVIRGQKEMEANKNSGKIVFEIPENQ